MEYGIGHQILIKLFILFFVTGSLNAIGQSRDYPPPACVVYDNLSLTICPPEPMPDPPVQLLSYNIYINDIYMDNLPVPSPYDTVAYMFEESQLIPGFNNFCVSAIYSDWISDTTCVQGNVVYGTELPFSEDWISGEFETNHWTVEGSHWVIDTEQGYPSPAAVFNGQPGINNYNESLCSDYFKADSISIEGIYIEYNVKLESINNTGHEIFRMEVWDSRDHEWHDGNEFVNYHGSFEWKNRKTRIFYPALGNAFRIRFRVFGTNSADITRWSIDNIKIYHECKAPEYLTVHKLPDNSRKLNWYNLLPFSPDSPLHWDNGTNYGNSIGTGGAAEFDVAARWTPEQIADYPGHLIFEVGFLPAEADANYSIRVWQGDSASELIVDQPVIFPEINDFNHIPLDALQPIDVTKELWVGYHVSAQTGYPVGVDPGPAVNGYGNMMNLGGWKTSLQINPQWDFNWNIFFSMTPGETDLGLNTISIYREENSNGEFQWLDSTNNFFQYIDQNTIEGATYCYKVNAVYNRGFENCTSPFSNVKCDPVLPGIEENTGSKINISIYPCPASEIAWIKCDIPIKQIEIYNSLGENVFAERCFEKEKVIALSNLPPGLYFIRIKTNEGLETRKVLVFR